MLVSLGMYTSVWPEVLGHTVIYTNHTELPVV